MAREKEWEEGEKDNTKYAWKNGEKFHKLTEKCIYSVCARMCVCGLKGVTLYGV